MQPKEFLEKWLPRLPESMWKELADDVTAVAFAHGEDIVSRIIKATETRHAAR